MSERVIEGNDADPKVLEKAIKVLMMYYGPVTTIRAVITEADNVISDMAKDGYIRDAKALSNIIEGVQSAMLLNFSRQVV